MTNFDKGSCPIWDLWVLLLPLASLCAIAFKEPPGAGTVLGVMHKQAEASVGV